MIDGKVPNLPVSSTSQPLVDVPLQEALQQRLQFFAKRFRQFDVLEMEAERLNVFVCLFEMAANHRQRHPIDLVLVFGFVLTKGRVPF